MANETTQEKNCTNCAGECKTQIKMPCKVCILVDGDSTEKLCYYCNFCKAYICCSKHRNDVASRGIAAVLNAGLNIAAIVKEVFTKPENIKPENEKAKTSNRRTGKHRQSDDVSGRV